MNSQKILVTAALPYANGPIHLGHLAGAYLPADIYTRYQRLKGREVLFLCGSDEHGVPITITADKEGITPQQVVDRYHEQNKAAFLRFGMNFDVYSRTSLPLHHDTAREFLVDFHARGILKERQERQFYDGKAKMFLPDRYVEGICPVCASPDARGDQCEKCGSYLNPGDLLQPRSKITGETPVFRETAHLYFPLGNYQQRLEEYIRVRDKRDGWKENVLNYCQSWFREGLQDRAVTRDLDWGVRIPLAGYEQKVLYVWFDAVLGYISAAKEWANGRGRPDEWKQYWLNGSTKYVAFIGKDNVVFHCIVFPAMLMAWNDGHDEQYVLPENVPANEFLNFEGQKFSKSRGWGIDVQDFLVKYPPDPLRYYLASALPEYRDSDFYWKEFQSKNNNELADILGNFINRSVAFTAKNFDSIVPKRGPLNDLDKSILEILRKTPVTAGRFYESYRLRDGLLDVMNLARAANKYFNDSQPWVTAKTDRARCSTTLNISLQIVRSLAVLMEPVIPFSSAAIFKQLNLTSEGAIGSWDSAGELLVPEGQRLNKPEILFAKIEDDMIEQELHSLGAGSMPGLHSGSPAKENTASPRISVDDLRKVDLRVARIVECEKVEKSRKLLRLQVVLGDERRQVLAGIAEHYTPESLIGKNVVVVANLEPARLMGHESQGMLLAASDQNGKLVIITTGDDVQPGSVVR